MNYNKNIQEKIRKYKKFFSDDTPGQILASISPYTFSIDYSPYGLKGKPLNEWNIKEEVCEYIDNEVAHLRAFMNYTKDLDNDFIPAVQGAYGIGLNSAYFSGADIIPGEDTSWVYPVINEWGDMDSLKMDKSNKWFQVLKQMTIRSVEVCYGDYVPATFPHFAPVDMANALRGNQLFYDFYDEPDKVHKLMDLSADAIIWLERELKAITKDVMGGSVVANMWIPGSAHFMSEDAADLCSAGIYREFCAPYTQKVINGLGGAYIHHHAKGVHIHGDIARLDGLKALEISWDPNCPRPIDHLEEIYELNKGLPLHTRCTAADVYEKIDIMKQGRLILMLDVTCLDESKRVMEFIRKHSRI